MHNFVKIWVMNLKLAEFLYYSYTIILYLVLMLICVVLQPKKSLTQFNKKNQKNILIAQNKCQLSDCKKNGYSTQKLQLV